MSRTAAQGDSQTPQDELAIREALGVTHSNESYTHLVSLAAHAADVFNLRSRVSKEALVGVPFLIIGVTVKEGALGIFVTLYCKLADNTDIVFSDSGVGIRDTVVTALNEGRLVLPTFCANGLRKSDYVNRDGIAGVTYYFA